ncbi:MAG TPA: SDR family oxidoreductase [Chloroflexota bacterium]|nr:SDR family oxidoreductase [Chloroflexota bacterium]
MTVNEKNVLVTGASSGIGWASVKRLDEAGFQVFAGVRTEADAARLRAQLSDRVVALPLDVCDEKTIEIASTTVAERIGAAGLYGLMNNAGIAVAGPLEYMPIREVRRQLETNVIGQLAVTQAFLPMLRQARGRIIFISSVGGRVAMPFLGPYAASKFAIEALADSLRIELSSSGIQVVLIEPGPVATPIWQKSIAFGVQTMQGFPPEADIRYGQRVRRLMRLAENYGATGVSADRVAEIILNVLRSNSPRARYLVATPASALVNRTLRWLPDRLRDWLVLRALGA